MDTTFLNRPCRNPSAPTSARCKGSAGCVIDSRAMNANATVTTANTETTVTAVVDRFLDAIAAGRGADLADVYAHNAHLDATVPNWRFSVTGATAIGTEYARWFSSPGRLEESERRERADGAVVTYLLAWEEDGVPHASHHCHVLTIDSTVDGGRIVADKVWCGGRWPAALLAEMEVGHGG
jgi:hypothetical protein